MSDKSYRKPMQGFTLIEVMVVIVILAILAAVIVPKIMSRPEQAKLVAAKQDVIAIENAMALYQLDNGVYPSNQQGIKALVTKPTSEPIPSDWQNGGYLKHVPKDPWGHVYYYRNPGQHGDIDIYSLGKNNDPNNINQANIIGNWEVDPEQKGS